MEPILRGIVSPFNHNQLVWEGLWRSTAQEAENKMQRFKYTTDFNFDLPSLTTTTTTLVFTGYFEMFNAKAQSKKSQFSERNLTMTLSPDGTVCGHGSNRFGRFELTGTFAHSVLEVKRTYTHNNTSTTPTTAKRRSVPCASPSAVVKDSSYLVEAQKLLLDLSRKDRQAWFAKPVVGLPDYARIVPEPMDFFTIQTKLNDKAYGSNVHLCVQDMRLVFTNALAYNVKGSPVHRAALDLLLHVDTFVKYNLREHKRVRVAKKYFQHVVEVEAPCRSPPLVGDEDNNPPGGFDSFDELDEDELHDMLQVDVVSPDCVSEGKRWLASMSPLLEEEEEL